MHALALAAGLLGVVSRAFAAQGPNDCANAEIVVDAKPMEVNTRTNEAVMREVVITQCDMRIQAGEARFMGGLNVDNGQWIISNDVRITADGGQITADKAVVSFRNRLIARATITGTPAQFEQKRDDGNLARGRAGTIDYQTAAGTVSLSGNAWLTTDGKNEISGQTLSYNVRTQSFQGRQKASTPEPAGTGRIRIVIPARKPADQDTAEEEEKKQ